MIKWTEETRKLSDLKPFEANPRKITDADLERLVNKIKTSGYHQRIRITHDDRIIGGHQRLKALKKCGYKEVAVLVPDAELTDEEYRREVIQDNLQDGSWDIEALAEWDIGQLNDWGLDTEALGLLIEEPEIEAEKEINFDDEYKIEISCKDEEEQERVFNQLENMNIKCRILTL